jgi:hypothetical protein
MILLTKNLSKNDKRIKVIEERNENIKNIKEKWSRNPLMEPAIEDLEFYEQDIDIAIQLFAQCQK